MTKSVIPESAQRSSGTQTRGAVRRDRCLWIPVFGCAETGMTPGGAA